MAHRIRNSALDTAEERAHALNTPLSGPGFVEPRAADALLFQDVPRVPSAWWGALPGEYAVPVPSYPAFVQMLRDARTATGADVHAPAATAPVVLGFWPEHVGLVQGGPFARLVARDCAEVWYLSTDDLARLLLHVLYHGQRGSVLAAAHVPPWLETWMAP